LGEEGYLQNSSTSLVAGFLHASTPARPDLVGCGQPLWQSRAHDGASPTHPKPTDQVALWVSNALCRGLDREQCAEAAGAAQGECYSELLWNAARPRDGSMPCIAAFRQPPSARGVLSYPLIVFDGPPKKLNHEVCRKWSQIDLVRIPRARIIVTFTAVSKAHPYRRRHCCRH
jgi:hypothetical protein